VRILDADESADRIGWLSGNTWPPEGGGTGFDPTGAWPAAAWVLNATYERDDMPADLTHHQLHQQAIAAGLKQPAIVNGMNLDELTVTTGEGLGFAEKPPPPWRRLTWSALGRREGFSLLAVDRRPEIPSRTQDDWDDPAVLPAGSWPLLVPAEQLSWPVSILPPAEGSLDAVSLQALIEVLAEHTAPAVLADCSFYYGVVGFIVAFMGEATIYAGDLRDLPSLVRAQRDMQLTPNNIWPPDRCWLVYTDYDLHATRVSGSPELIDAVCGHRDLDTFRCEPTLGKPFTASE
jgi:hypothetical protein